MSEKKTANDLAPPAVASTSATTVPASTSAATSSSNNNGTNSASSSASKGANASPAPASVSAGAPAPAVQEDEAISYVNQEGEWKYRKINLFRVVRGFVSQLKPGQDLTKVSLPAECCTPYGLLEVMGSRELAMFHLTFGMNRHPDDAMERFFSALRFFFGTVRSERFDKKPWNPVLGETHITYADVIYGPDGVGLTETASAANGAASSSNASSSSAAKPNASSSANSAAGSTRSRTVFVGEQVSHHPPISAICLSNDREQIQCQANVSFTVKFGGNQVTVATAGELQLTSKKFNETYELTKCLPDMVVRNVVWGKKYIMWEGEVTMTCPQTGITAFLKFKEKSSQNVVKGYIMRGESDEPLYEINGVCGEKIMYHLSASGKASEKTLLDLTTEPIARVRYLPRSKLAPLSSIAVWTGVNKAIVDDDMTLADKEKKVIEQAQRERAKARMEANQDFQGYHFDMSPEGMWVYKNNMDLNTVLEEGAHSMDEQFVQEDSENSSGEDEFVSQEDQVEPLIDAGASGGAMLSDADRSPITSGDELDEADSDAPPSSAQSISQSSSQTDLQKRRRGSSAGTSKNASKAAGLSQSSSTLAPSASKKELRAEKKKAREEVKMVVTKMKEEKKKGTVATQLLEGQIYAGWCKVRNMMKKWKDRYLVVLPGRLVIFRSPKEATSGTASGLIQLQGCDVRPRPSKKDGACFKIYSLNQYPIYSRQGLKGETISSALLPVGSDYLILRCADPTYMHIWIEKIRASIPDWEKNKSFIKSAGLELDDSDSDEDSVEDSEPENSTGAQSTASPSSQLSPGSLSSNGGGNNSLATSSAPGLGSRPITNEDVLSQIGQLYKITRKMSQRQRKHMEAMDEFRTKQTDALAEIRSRSGSLSSSSAAPGATTGTIRKSPFDKQKGPDSHGASSSSSGGIAGKIKAQFDPKTIVLLLVIIYLLYAVFSANPAAPSIPSPEL